MTGRAVRFSNDGYDKEFKVNGLRKFSANSQIILALMSDAKGRSSQ
jgi:hypothetical protein